MAELSKATLGWLDNLFKAELFALVCATLDILHDEELVRFNENGSPYWVANGETLIDAWQDEDMPPEEE